MSQHPDIASFIRTWTYLRGMTISFVEAVPDEHWSSRITDKHGPLCKQFRHMVWVSDLYMCALRDGKINMATKKESYDGSTERSNIVTALRERDTQLAKMLEDSRFVSDTYRVDFFGTPMTFHEFTHVMIQHEALHQGMWSVYARQAGFDVPKGWKDDWEL